MMNLKCYSCSKSISSPVPDKTTFRGIGFCPECVERGDDGTKQAMREGAILGEIQTLQGYLDVYSTANPPLTIEAIRTRLDKHIKMANEALAQLREGQYHE